MSDLPICAILTGNSNSGSACIKEIFEKYSDTLKLRGVFRTKKKAQPFEKLYPSLEIVTGIDASQPDSLNEAFKDAKSALIVTVHDPKRGFEEDAMLTENLIQAAVENGVKYIVLVGSFTVKDPKRISIISSRFMSPEKTLEKLGNETDLKWTVLRGGCFMENILPAFNKIKSGEDMFVYPECDVPMVDTSDIGRSAAACLASKKINEHDKKCYEINGPEFLTGDAIATYMSKCLGREIKYCRLEREEYHKFMPKGVAEVMDYFGDKGKEAAPFTEDNKKLTGQTGNFEAFLKKHI